MYFPNQDHVFSPALCRYFPLAAAASLFMPSCLYIWFFSRFLAFLLHVTRQGRLRLCVDLKEG